MMARANELANLQRWLLDAVTNSAPPPFSHIDEVLLPGRDQSAAERLDVYRQAYLARLLEVLREQFPCTRFAVGDELFDQLATGYLRAFPPSSYTLANLADQLVEHLDTTRPTDWGEFIVELARLEQAIDRVFDGAGPEKLPPFTLSQNVDESLRLTLAPGFTLLGFRYPVSSFYTAWKADHRPQWPQQQPQSVALLRRDYIVRRYALSSLQYELLSAISDGVTLGEAIESAITDAGDNTEADSVALIHDWFLTWAASGFFVSAR